jgi:hypothetical protein
MMVIQHPVLSTGLERHRKFSDIPAAGGNRASLERPFQRTFIFISDLQLSKIHSSNPTDFFKMGQPRPCHSNRSRTSSFSRIGWDYNFARTGRSLTAALTLNLPMNFRLGRPLSCLDDRDIRLIRLVDCQVGLESGYRILGFRVHEWFLLPVFSSALPAHD